MKATIIQLNAGGSKSDNLKNLTRLVRAAVNSDDPDFIILPEMSLCISAERKKVHASADEITPQNSTVRTLSSLAKELDVFLHLGSFAERTDDKVYNTSVVFDRTGDIVASYRKIHRFDVTMPDGTEVRESDNVERGNDMSLYDYQGFRIGCSICYDIRFSELFLKLRNAGAEIITIPSAFTRVTGMDHWEVLVRARAIETQCYVLAPNQIGAFDDGKGQLYGHSMIVDPWGQIIAQISNREGWATANIDRNLIQDVRARIPVATHRIFDNNK